jgi:tetratricopeptide (TPR) repeat protein
MPSANVRRSATSRLILPLFITPAAQSAWGQAAIPPLGKPNQQWVGRRIVTLGLLRLRERWTVSIGETGWSRRQYRSGSTAHRRRPYLDQSERGRRTTCRLGEQDERDAIPYFTSLIEHDPKNWDAHLRRAESTHVLNQRDAAIVDYTRAIELHRDEAFLFLRRGREFRIMKACPQAAADFEQATKLRPQWLEAYNQAAGIYSDCPGPTFRDPNKAIAFIEHAIALDKNPNCSGSGILPIWPA